MEQKGDMAGWVVSLKNGRDDPGARFAAFDVSYRLSFVCHWLTPYTDFGVHDDVPPPMRRLVPRDLSLAYARNS